MNIHHLVLSAGTKCDLYVDLVNRGSRISVRFDDESDPNPLHATWQQTPHQSAEVSSVRRAAQLAIDYFAGCDGPDDGPDDEPETIVSIKPMDITIEASGLYSHRYDRPQQLQDFRGQATVCVDYEHYTVDIVNNGDRVFSVDNTEAAQQLKAALLEVGEPADLDELLSEQIAEMQASLESQLKADGITLAY